MSDLFGSICLTDIPKELITVGKNGKKYLTVTIAERRTPSQYGHTHYIKAYAKKEQRREGVNYYIGELKPSQYDQGQQQPQPSTPAGFPPPPPAYGAPAPNDDLPF